MIAALALLRDSIRSISQLVTFARPHRAQFAVMASSIVLISLVAMAPPIITGRVIDSLTSGQIKAVFLLIVIQISLGIVETVIGFAQGRSTLLFTQGFAIHVRLALARRLQTASIAEVVTRPLGEITNRLDGDIQAAAGSIVSVVTAIVSLATMSWLIVVMPFINYKLALVSYVFIPLWFFAFAPSAARFTKMGRLVSEARDDFDTAISERLSLGGILRVKSFGRYDDDIGILRSRQEAIRNLQLASLRMGFPIGLAQNLLSVLAPGAIVFVGAFLVAKHECSIGTLVAFLGFASRLYSPVSVVSGLQMQLATVSGIFQRIFDILNLPVEQDTTAPEAPESTAIVFKSVAFSYGAHSVLSDCSFELKESEKVILMGPSGCGKTTVARLLLRFYEPSAGEIMFGGLPVRNISLVNLRNEIGYVPQEANVFSGTLRENLLYARPGATNADMWEVLRVCCLDSFVAGFERNLDEVIGSQGAALSGGQRQRLSIARTLLAEPSALVLDEATSAVDAATETLLYERLFERYPRMTMIIITHNIPHLSTATRTIRLDQQAKVLPLASGI